MLTYSLIKPPTLRSTDWVKELCRVSLSGAYADVAYDVCRHMLTYAGVCWRMTYAGVCWRMLTYALCIVSLSFLTVSSYITALASTVVASVLVTVA